MKHISKLLQSKKTVFTYDDIRLLLSMGNHDTIKSFFARSVAQGLLTNISQGTYAFYDYNILELASKIKKQSYISFETVLKSSGVIFQDYGNTIFAASNNSITKHIHSTSFIYLKLKNSILTNPLGLIHKGNYIIATPERAVCDRLYLSPDYYFDDLSGLNFEFLAKISHMYNKRVVLAIQKLIHDAQSRKT